MKALLVVLLLLASTVATRATCHFDYIRVTQVEGRDYVDLQVENLTPADLTITFSLDQAENVGTDRPMPTTSVLAGGQKATAFRVTLPRDNRRWRWHSSYKLLIGNMYGHHDDSAVYRLPYVSGKAFPVMQGFNGTFSHYGNSANAIDWKMPIGTDVLAARAGTVVFTCDSFSEGAPDRALEDCCNRVVIRHVDGSYGEYDHLDLHGVAVRVGQMVEAGDRLGRSGNTGFTTGPHLHFMVYLPLDGAKNRTFPVKYQVAGRFSPVILNAGESYTAP